MKKVWNNPEINELGVKFTNEEIGSITIAEDANGKNSKSYTEAEAYTKLLWPEVNITWYFYDICANEWVSTHKSSLCEAIKYAFAYMREHYPNGCHTS